MKNLQTWLTLFYGAMILGVMGIFYFPVGTSSAPIVDLRGQWEICAPKSLGSQGDCHWTVTEVPSDAPASVMATFTGWLVYRKTFPTPAACVEPTSACKLVLGEVGDAVEANLNGKVIGRHGDFPPNASYARNYSAVFDVGRDAFRTGEGKNELVLTVHSFKKKQTGLRGGPVAVMSSVGAFRAARSHILSIVVVPLFEAVVLLFIAAMSGYLARYHRISGRTISLFSLFCFSSSLFMFSVSETVREYLPIFYAGYLHYFFRSLYDWSNFAAIAVFFFPNSRRLKRLHFLYAFSLLAYGACLVGDLTHVQLIPGYVGFDTAIMIMRSTFPLVLLPWVLAMVGSWRQKKIDGRGSLVIASYAALFAMQFFDVLQFWGVNLHTDFYFGRYFQTFAALVLGYLITRRYQNEHTARQADLQARLRTNEAIARLTQMLAHDVRKPFSILKIGMAMLERVEKNVADVQMVLGKFVPEVDRATRSIDALIQDVMEIGSTSKELLEEAVSPQGLVENAITETCRVYPKADVHFLYDFQHDGAVLVDTIKIGRVFSNILDNALQAMNARGEVWFRTRNVRVDGKSYVEFCLGNSGSYIPVEARTQLFEAFYTSGKKGGTGLGLAIAQKVVQAHGGTIWCESTRDARSPEGKVEFFFTVPASGNNKNASTAFLPRHASEVASGMQAFKQRDPEPAQRDEGDLSLERQIAELKRSLGRPVRVLIVDDEAIYRSSLHGQLARSGALTGAVTVSQAADALAALDLLAGEPVDLIITDIDMGKGSLDGFALVALMRAKPEGARSLICVHSNRLVEQDQERALAAGANAFIPKPIARGQLLKLVLQAGRRSLAEATPPLAASRDAVRHIAVIDDNPFILEAWVDSLSGDAVVHAFSRPDELQQRVGRDAAFLGRLSCVITDMHFDTSASDGVGAGRWIKQQRPDLRVFLASDAELVDVDLAGSIDQRLPKRWLTFTELERSLGT